MPELREPPHPASKTTWELGLTFGCSYTRFLYCSTYRLAGVSPAPHTAQMQWVREKGPKLTVQGL